MWDTEDKTKDFQYPTADNFCVYSGKDYEWDETLSRTESPEGKIGTPWICYVKLVCERGQKEMKTGH